MQEPQSGFPLCTIFISWVSVSLVYGPHFLAYKKFHITMDMTSIKPASEVWVPTAQLYPFL